MIKVKVEKYFSTLTFISERGDTFMEKEELKDKIFAFCERFKGKKKLKERDVIKGVSEETGTPPDDVKKALREMIDVGRLMYSYAGGASSVEIPSEEYLREKGLIK
ncbi:MAG: hypothetical protein AB1638_00225 [Nitrospirota bacterium]